MIKRLKIKFILLTMVTLFLLLAFIISGMNILNYNSITQDADALLFILSENQGAFPEFKFGPPGKFPDRMTPETPYESRYFSVLLANRQMQHNRCSESRSQICGTLSQIT